MPCPLRARRARAGGCPIRRAAARKAGRTAPRAKSAPVAVANKPGWRRRGGRPGKAALIRPGRGDAARPLAPPCFRSSFFAPRRRRRRDFRLRTLRFGLRRDGPPFLDPLLDFLFQTLIRRLVVVFLGAEVI